MGDEFFTYIRISREVASLLKTLKRYKLETYDEIIRNLIKGLRSIKDTQNG